MTVKPSLSDLFFFFLLNIFVFQFYVKSVSPVSDRDLLKLVLGTCIAITMRPRKEIAPGKAGSRTWGDRVMPYFSASRHNLILLHSVLTLGSS